MNLLMKEFGDALLISIKGYVSERVDSIIKRLDDVQARLDSVKDGEKGDKGDKGEPGESIKGDKGEKGDPGESIKGEKGEPGESIKGDKGDKGDKGEPGESIKGEPGEPGKDGERGLDALDIDVLPAINEERRYARGTFASHKGGLWVSRRSTDGMDGWECIVNGLDAIEAMQDPNDPRKFGIGIKSADGRVVTKEFRIPAMMDRGVFKEGTSYEEGDVVSWAGCAWVAKSSTESKPDTADGWRLMVKKGRDGKDGKDGIDLTKGVKL